MGRAQERKAVAASWREIAREFERGEQIRGLCYAANEWNICPYPTSLFTGGIIPPGMGHLWVTRAHAPYYGVSSRVEQENDSRVLAACLIAAMIEAGDLDEAITGEPIS